MSGPFTVGLRAPHLPEAWPDLRLVPAALAAWMLAIGVLLLGPVPGAVVVGSVVGALGVAALLARRARRPGARATTGALLVVLVAVGAAGAVALARAASVRPPVVQALVEAGRAGEVDLVVTGDPVALTGRWSTGRVRVASRLEQVRTSNATTRVRVPVTVFAPASWGGLLPGTGVRVRARFGPTDRREDAALLLVRGPPAVVHGPGRVQRAAGSLREGLRESVAGFPADPRALVPAMVLGDTSGLSDELEDAGHVTGLTHLTAVSGANVAVILAATLAGARLLGARRRLLVVVGLLSVLAFVVVARPEPSVVRAAVMGSIALVGLMRGTTGRGLQILAAGVLLLLVVNPWLAISIGFALSVVATAALLVVAPWWRERLARRLPRWVAEPLAVAAVAHLATAPLIAAISGRISLVAVGTNLAVEPAVALVTVCGALATVVGPVSPTAARWCAWPAGWGAAWVALVAHRGAALPLADIAWPASPWAIAALAVLVVSVLVGGPGAAARLGRAVRSGRGPARQGAPSVGGPWHASADVQDRNPPGPRDARRGTRGPPRRARRRRGRRRRARGRRRRRRP